MGYLYKNVCLPTLEQAQLNECQDFTNVSYVGSDIYRHTCQPSQGGYSVVTELNGTVTQTIPLSAIDYPTCDYVGGVGISYDYFLLALVLLSVIWGGKKLIQLFEFHHVD